jgi:putative ABC transport system substrate-binding protein
MIRRREFITLLGSAAAAPVMLCPLAARAQQPAMPVVGFLSGRSLASDAHLVAAFRQGLNETGYVDGQNVAIEFRWADGQLDRLPALAAELVRRQVVVIFAGAVDVQIRTLHAAITTIPLVFATGGDPIALGLGTSFNRPGGNATGVTVITAALWPKRLELLRELATPAAAVALLVNPDNQTAGPAIRDLQAATRGFGQNAIVLNARTEGDFDTAFATLIQERVGTLVVADDALFMNRREKLVALAALHSVPAIYGRREYPAAGGLMSYGASTPDQYRQSGIYAGRILKGAKPADLPFLQPTKFELVINLKTAKALGLTVPMIMQMTADEVIE